MANIVDPDQIGSDQGLHCLLCRLHLRMHYSMVNPFTSHFRIITVIFSDVQTFRSFTLYTEWPLVREKSGKFYFSSRSGKTQGILQIGQGNFKYQESHGKVREFHNFDYLKCEKVLIIFLSLSSLA